MNSSIDKKREQWKVLVAHKPSYTEEIKNESKTIQRAFQFPLKTVSKSFISN